MEKILSKKLPIEIVFKIKNNLKINKKFYNCNICKKSVTYNEYIDGVGYICYGCLI